MTKKRRGAHLPRFLVGLLVGALALAGCAQIETELTVNEDLSGTRVMVARLSQSDLETNVRGTIEEVNAAVEGALPPALNFSPFSSVTGGYEATFTLPFANPQDYAEKAQALLDAGAVDRVAEVVIERASSPFSTGTRVEENFSSVDLLKWSEDPIISAGLAAEHRRKDILNSGETVLVVDGEAQAIPGDQVTFDTLGSSGFSEVALTTVYNESDGTWSRTFRLAMVSSDYQALERKVLKFFAENVPSGVKVVETTGLQEGAHSWEVIVVGLDAAEVADVSDAVLATTGSQFAFTQEEGYDAQIAALKGTLVDTVSCSGVCASPDATIVDTLTPPAGWLQVSDDAVLEEVPFEIWATQNEPISVIRYLALESVGVDLSFALDGSASLEVQYALPATEAEPNRDLLAAVFEFADGGVSVTQGEDVWKFTAHLKEPTAEALAAAIRAALPGSEVQLYQAQTFFTRSVQGTLWLDFTSVLGQEPGTDALVYEVSPSVMGRVDIEGEGGPPVHFDATMPTLTSFVFWGVLGLAVAVGGVLTLLFRRKIPAARDAKRQVTPTQSTTS